MCGEFGEVTVIIGLVINFLAFVSPFVSFRDTLTYNTELSIIAQYYIQRYLDTSVYKTELSWYQLFSEGEEQNQAFHNN